MFLYHWKRLSHVMYLFFFICTSWFSVGISLHNVLNASILFLPSYWPEEVGDFTTMYLFFTSQRLNNKYNKEKLAIEVFMEETRHTWKGAVKFYYVWRYTGTVVIIWLIQKLPTGFIFNGKLICQQQAWEIMLNFKSKQLIHSRAFNGTKKEILWYYTKFFLSGY